MKRFLCLAMTVLLVLPIFANPVLAAETQMSTESLFLNYPQYLTNERMNEGTAACESAYYAVLNSYNNKGDSFVAALITALNDGLTIQFQNIASKFGFTRSYAEKNLIKATNCFLEDYLSVGSEFQETADRFEKAIKNLKKNYKTVIILIEVNLIKTYFQNDFY